MSFRAHVRALVSGLGGDFDRCGGRITAPDTAAGSEGIRDGVGWVWGGWGRYLEAAGHGRGGRCVVRWAKNGEKRALSLKKIDLRTNAL
eukprot:scaffold86043_cov36-Cyclotella_meneghiniana.AAC.1